jgi:hypothetical protein
MSASTVISLILRGRDDGASAALDSVARKSDGLQGAFGDVISFGTNVGKAVATGLGIAGGAAIAAGGIFLNLGSDVEEMQGKFNVVFANTGDQVVGALDAFGEAVGRNKFELHGMASEFGDLLKPMGFTEEAAASMAIGLTELATDLSSFNNMPMDEAARRLMGTLIGSHENALKFGVVINENTLAAELAAQGWEKLTGAELEAAKVQARLNLLMAGTTDAQGDAARTAGSWANQTRALKASLMETAQEIGLGLLPAATPLLELFGSMAGRVLPALTSMFENHIIPAIDKVSHFIQVVVTGLEGGVEPLQALENGLLAAFGPDIAEKVMGVAEPIHEFVTEIVLPFARDHAEELKGALIGIGIVLGGAALIGGIAAVGAALATLLSPVGLVIAGAALLGAAWRGNWGGIQEKTAEAWEFIRPKLEAAREWLAEKVPAAVEAMREWFDEHVPPIIAWLKEEVPAALEAMREWFGETVTNIQEWWDDLTEATNTLVANIQEKFDNAKAAVQPFIDAIQNFAAWLRSNVLEIKVNLPSLPSWATPGSPIPLHTAWADYHNFLERNQFEPRFDLDQVPAMPNGSGRPQLRPMAGSQPRTVIERIEVHIHDTAAAELFLAHLDALSDDAGLAF